MAATKKARIGRPPSRTQDAAIHLRVDADLFDRLDALTASVEHLGIARSGVVRALIIGGLREAERDPRVLIGATTSTKAKR